MRTLLAVLLLAMGTIVTAQPKPPTAPCAAPEHRQFDFWVGEWRVTTPDGKHAGDNRIEKVLDGCALHESWQNDRALGSLFHAATGNLVDVAPVQCRRFAQPPARR